MKKLYLKDYMKSDVLLASFLNDPQYETESQEFHDFIERYYSNISAYNYGFDPDYEFETGFMDFHLANMIAYAATHFSAFEKMLFKEDSLTHEDFFNLSYFWGTMGLFNANYNELLGLLSDEINSVSLSKLLSIELSDIFDTGYSEIEIYDTLITMTPRTTVMILERVTNNRDCKSILKKSILEKDESTFIETILRYNVDLNYVSRIIGILKLRDYINKRIEDLNKIKQLVDNDNYEEKKEFVLNLYDNNEGNYDIKTCNALIGSYQFAQELQKDEIGLCIPNIDWSYIYHLETYMLVTLLYLHEGIKPSVSNIKTVYKVENAINNWTYMHLLSEKIKLGEIDPFNYNIDDKLLKDFRDQYIELLELPENILVGAKNTNDYLESSFAPDKWFCIRLYKALVKANFLSYNEDIFYSFIYRMSRDYKGKEEPIKIVWLGKPREIYYFIYRFCNNAASKMWHKTAMFFCLPEGVELKENGVKNQAKPTPKIESIINDFFK